MIDPIAPSQYFYLHQNGMTIESFDSIRKAQTKFQLVCFIISECVATILPLYFSSHLFCFFISHKRNLRATRYGPRWEHTYLWCIQIELFSTVARHLMLCTPLMLKEPYSRSGAVRTSICISTRTFVFFSSSLHTSSTTFIITHLSTIL